jgi:hypothetical protein
MCEVSISHAAAALFFFRVSSNKSPMQLHAAALRMFRSATSQNHKMQPMPPEKVKYDGDDHQGVSSISRKRNHRCNRAEGYWKWGIKDKHPERRKSWSVSLEIRRSLKLSQKEFVFRTSSSKVPPQFRLLAIDCGNQL